MIDSLTPFAVAGTPRCCKGRKPVDTAIPTKYYLNAGRFATSFKGAWNAMEIEANKHTSAHDLKKLSVAREFMPKIDALKREGD